MGTRIFESPWFGKEGQRLEVGLQKLRVFAAYGFHLCSLTSDV